MSMTADDLRDYYSHAWELNLLACADPAHLERTTFKYRIQAVVDAVAEARPASVLDMGCGVGSTSFLLARLLPITWFTCVDISARQIAAGERHARQHGLTNRFTFKSADVCEPVTGQYDAVIASEIIEHLPEPGRMLTHLRRSGHDRTRYVFTVPLGEETNGNVAYRQVHKFTDENRVVEDPADLLDGNEWSTLPFFHKLYRRDEALLLFKACGYRVESVAGAKFDGRGLGRYLRRFGLRSITADRLLNRLTGGTMAENLIAVCRRA